LQGNTIEERESIAQKGIEVSSMNRRMVNG
jgi:hypothetical protein